VKDKGYSHKKGKLGEKIAEEFLLKSGYLICERNFHSRYGEIDIIAKCEKYLCFTEVKARSCDDFASPIDYVDKFKCRRIIKTAIIYLSKNISHLQPRFDVIEILFSKYDKCKIKIRHVKNAFYREKFDEFF
jgi:putative endonuclease